MSFACEKAIDASDLGDLTAFGSLTELEATYRFYPLSENSNGLLPESASSCNSLYAIFSETKNEVSHWLMEIM